MAAKKQFTTIKTKLESNISKIDLDTIDFGEVIMNESTKEFELTIDDDVNDLLLYLQSFINDIENKKEEYKSTKVNEKIIETLKSDTSQAETLRNIFKNNTDNNNQ